MASTSSETLAAGQDCDHSQMDIPFILICGYTRLSAPQKVSIPEAILPLIHEYAVLTFEWNAYLCTKQYHIAHNERNKGSFLGKACLTFSNEGRSIEPGSQPTNYYCPSINILSADIHSRVVWGVEMEMGANVPMFCFGFVQYPFGGHRVQNDDWNYWLGNPPYQSTHFGLSLCPLADDIGDYDAEVNWELIGSHATANIENAELENGNTLSVDFDFTMKSASFYHNGEPVKGAVYRNLPTKILPVMIICNGLRFTTRK